jgi:hypothetical protein
MRPLTGELLATVELVFSGIDKDRDRSHHCWRARRQGLADQEAVNEERNEWCSAHGHPLCGVGPFVVMSQTPFMGAEFPQGFHASLFPALALSERARAELLERHCIGLPRRPSLYLVLRAIPC